MRFRATLLLSGRTATGFEVPADVLAGLGAGKRPPVRVTIGGYTYRNTVGSMGGVPMIGVSAEHRAAAGVAAGDELEIELELDTEPRVVSVPPDLAAALPPDGRRAFDALSYSNQLRWVLSVQDAKTDATRRRRIDKVVEAMGGG